MGILPSVHRSPGSTGGRRRYTVFLPFLLAIVFLAEIVFLFRLDMATDAVVMRRWATSSYFETNASSTGSSESLKESSSSSVAGRREVENEVDEDGTWFEECRAMLEKDDTVPYSRDFRKDPILVEGPPEDWSSCSVGCKFGHAFDKKIDASFGLQTDRASVLRSMESSQYYFENNLSQARRSGYDITMTTSLSSDVPVGYFSWAEYDIMAPVLPKTEEALAAAFISNCGAHNFRVQALVKLESLNIKVDSYGACHRNRNGKVDKLATLRHYKFSLAFENSNEEDYVTEKFFQSLVAGSVPVVIGAPNIQDFAPSNNSLLHIRELHDISAIAKTMKYLDAHPDAYNETLRWKYDGPSDSFKALVDMAAIHSSCRLCIHLATMIQEKEESTRFQNRSCKCSSSLGVLYHLYVRERGRFEMESIFLRSTELTVEALESAVLNKFKSLNHVPVWKKERPESIKGGDELKIYRIYPVGMTQRDALYTFRFNSDDLQRHIISHHCAKLEVIFV